MEFEFYGKPHKKKHRLRKHWLAITIGIFISILSLLIYTSFYGGNLSLTGNAIIGGITKSNESSAGDIEFNAKLTVPSLDIDGKFENVELTGSSNSYLQVGNQRFYLGKVKQNFLIFEDYDGKISLDSKNILEFKGKASIVTINGVSVTSDSKATSKINFNSSFRYDTIKIDDEVLIDELSYKTTGTLMLNNVDKIFNINNEEITINNFQGNLLIENNEFILEGYVDGLDIVGDINIHIEG